MKKLKREINCKIKIIRTFILSEFTQVNVKYKFVICLYYFCIINVKK